MTASSCSDIYVYVPAYDRAKAIEQYERQKAYERRTAETVRTQALDYDLTRVAKERKEARAEFYWFLVYSAGLVVCAFMGGYGFCAYFNP